MRTAALYKLEDLLLLKISCSIFTATDRMPQLKADIEHNCQQLLGLGLLKDVYSVGLYAYGNVSTAPLWPCRASCKRLRQCSLA